MKAESPENAIAAFDNLIGEFLEAEAKKRAAGSPTGWLTTADLSITHNRPLWENQREKYLTGIGFPALAASAGENQSREG